jgi:putative transposase
MRTEQSCYSTAEMCLALGVSRSGLYDHTQKHQGERRQQDEELAEQIALIFLQSRRTYGSRRIQQMLRRGGIYCGKNRICRLMDGQGLQPLQKRRFRPQTTQSRHAEPIAPNRLKELPQAPQRPNEIWAADITYLPTLEEGWLYLAAEMGSVFEANRRLEAGRFVSCAAGDRSLPAGRLKLVGSSTTSF